MFPFRRLRVLVNRDVHLVDDTVRISTIAVGLIIVLGVAGYSYSSKVSEETSFLLTSLLAASSYLALGQFVYAEPHSTGLSLSSPFLLSRAVRYI